MSDEHPLRVARFVGAWGLPSASPFCVKLETWLRIAGIPYEAETLTGPPKSKTRKVPYAHLGDELMHDSGLIIERLKEERGVDPDAGLSQAQRATFHLLRRTIEESLYFVLLWERWIVDENWEIVREAYFGSLPLVVKQVLPEVVRQRVRKSLQGQGYGRHLPKDVEAIGCQDIDAIAVTLGDGEFFAAQPGTIDATAYAFLENVLTFPRDTATKKAALRHDNLVRYCERMRERYWS